jgi:hypothetical protein
LAALALLITGLSLWVQALPGPTSWLDIVSAGGVPGVLVLGIWGLYKEWVVPGPLYRRERERAERLERMVITLLDANQKVVGMAERAVGTP